MINTEIMKNFNTFTYVHDTLYEKQIHAVKRNLVEFSLFQENGEFL